MPPRRLASVCTVTALDIHTLVDLWYVPPNGGAFGGVKKTRRLVFG